ncbi:hypothetical protein GCM10027262_39590 [Nocardia tengchongensis]
MLPGEELDALGDAHIGDEQDGGEGDRHRREISPGRIRETRVIGRGVSRSVGIDRFRFTHVESIPAWTDTHRRLGDLG